MASGDHVVQVLAISPPSASYATIDTMVGGSTPGEVITVWDFDASSVEYLDFRCRLHGYDADVGITLRLFWSATSATSGATVWEAAVRRVADDGEDIDGAHTYVYNQVVATAPTAAGEVDYTTITFTDGADMDDWADGELAIVRIRRLATDGSDTMAGDAELWQLLGEET